MSQQGEKPTGHEDDWWGQLYDDSTGDTGPAPAADTLDDRFASASGTVGRSTAGEGAGAPPRAEAPPLVPEQRGAEPDVGSAPQGSGSAPLEGAGGDGGVGGAYADAFRPETGAETGAAAGPGDLRPEGAPRGPAPWEPPSTRPSGPLTFPPGPKPPGFHAEPPRSGAAADPSPTPLPPVHPPATAPPVPAGAPRPPADLPPLPDRPPPDAAHPTDRPAHPTDRPGADASHPPTPRPAAMPSPPPVPPFEAAPRGLAPHAPPSPPGDGPPASSAPEASAAVPPRLTVPRTPPPVAHVGSGPPTYHSEPTALPLADPDDLDDLVPDTVLDGARYGACTLRAASVRGDSGRYRGEPRRDALLTARFGTGDQALVLVVVATGARATPGAHRAAAEACHWIGRSVGRSHVRLGEDIRAARRGDLKSGLHRLTDRSLGKLRASAAEQGVGPEEYTASLRCLLLPADPACRTRVFFGVGPGGLFRLRDGDWQDIEPQVAEAAGEPVVGFGSLPSETPEGDRLTMDLGITTPPSPYEPAPEPPRDPFRFRTSIARPGDMLLLCSSGLADPLRGEPELAEHLTARWSGGEPPGLAAFLADTLVRVKGYADDRTAAAVWEA
ncbi:PP2C family serine/threonine-protein phosphatase [Streptomyces sp. TP-A0356]|uniref:PP2C family serine/threonine-protein phosphatase n=1 Tax=Streptomyces sp. TP-A0356 TaxID=1359208 RepID=UPI0006E15CB9|nr:PP2C family serine/threonine-protein phosphatase [Streptomyces sp. TP-A0356]